MNRKISNSLVQDKFEASKPEFVDHFVYKMVDEEQDVPSDSDDDLALSHQFPNHMMNGNQKDNSIQY